MADDKSAGSGAGSHDSGGAQSLTTAALRAGVKLQAGTSLKISVVGVSGRPLPGGRSVRSVKGFEDSGSDPTAAAPEGSSSAPGQVVDNSNTGNSGGASEGAHGDPGGKFVIESTVIAFGGTPLANESVRIVDPDSGAQIGTVQTDKDGVLRAHVPAEKEYHLFVASDGSEEMATAHEDHPNAGERPNPALHSVLFFEVLDKAGKPVANEKITITRAGGKPSSGQTDASGQLKIACDPGVYSLTVKGKKFTAHTLFTGDLGDKQQPYRFSPH